MHPICTTVAWETMHMYSNREPKAATKAPIGYRMLRFWLSFL